jgi:hypothetical protein
MAIFGYTWTIPGSRPPPSYRPVATGGNNTFTPFRSPTFIVI